MPGRPTRLAAVVVLGLCAASLAQAQCMLANPSFEVPGSGGATFGGWSQFGPTGLSTRAIHGQRSARVNGPNTGTWNVAGFWQPMDCAPGQSWSASVTVLHSPTAPLAGGSQAILNIEWRDSGGNLISYESHVAADAATPADGWRTYSVQSGPAPAGTTSIHFVLGVLQGPTDPTPEVLFDTPNLVLLTTPSLDTQQWGDFGSGRTVIFGGRTWRVKGPGYLGPGPNLFDNGPGGVSVDGSGRLHLTIHKIGASWYSSEVALNDALGYGDYIFTTRGRLDLYDRNAVLGMFLWQYGPCYDTGYLWWNAYDEIDVEIGRWGSVSNPNVQFVAQPANWAGNLYRFSVAPGDTELVSHAMHWLPDRVEYRCWRGGPDAESAATRLASWTYTGPHIPRPEMPRVHLNFWQLAAPTVTQEAVFDAFTFRAACPGGNCGVLEVSPPPPAATLLPGAAPNPIRTGTVLRFTLPAAGDADVAIYDVSGRKVRQLASGPVAAGEHFVEWNARDDSGQRVPAGVYLYRIRAAGTTQAKRVVVVQ